MSPGKHDALQLTLLVTSVCVISSLAKANIRNDIMSHKKYTYEKVDKTGSQLVTGSGAARILQISRNNLYDLWHKRLIPSPIRIVPWATWYRPHLIAYNEGRCSSQFEDGLWRIWDVEAEKYRLMPNQYEPESLLEHRPFSTPITQPIA